MDASILVVSHSIPAVSAVIEAKRVVEETPGITDDSQCPSGLCARIALCSLQR
jgi:hypothetical protein